MKTLLSLILPETSVFRYLKNGRKGIGFNGGVLVTCAADGTEAGVNALAVDDCSTAADSTTIATRFFTYTGTASSKTLTLPAVDGEIRDVTILNLSNQTVTVAAATGKVTYGTTTGGNSYTITTGQATALKSNGSMWYRVSLG